eukprot:2595758-Pyramimonas_sp.AAC.1
MVILALGGPLPPGSPDIRAAWALGVIFPGARTESLRVAQASSRSRGGFSNLVGFGDDPPNQQIDVVISETCCRGQLPIRKQVLKSRWFRTRVAKFVCVSKTVLSRAGDFGNYLPNRAVGWKQALKHDKCWRQVSKAKCCCGNNFSNPRDFGDELPRWATYLRTRLQIRMTLGVNC